MDIVNILVEKLTAWGVSTVAALPNLALALLVFLAFWLVARFAPKALRGGLERMTGNQAVIDLLSSLTRAAILAVGLFVALGILGLQRTLTSLLAGLGVIGLALAFAFQDIAANFVSGVILAIRRPFRVGDIIESNDFYGTVEALDLRATVGKNFEGQMVTIPNKDVLQNKLTNYTVSHQWRVDIPVGVAYGDDLEKAERVAIEAVEGLERDERREIELYYEGFGDSSIGFRLRIWIDPTRHSFLTTRHEGIKRVQRAFAEAGITIPFPIRTLDFGWVGGEKLDEVLPKAISGPRGGNGARAPAPQARAERGE